MQYEEMSADAGPTPPEPVRRRRGLRTALAIVAVGVVAAGAAGVAYASESSPTPAPSGGYGYGPGASGGPGEHHGGPGADPGGHRGGPRGGGFGGPGAMGVGGTVLHSLSVVAGKDGKTTTVATQRGTVTDVGDSSVTVKSEDGYTATYRVTKDTTFFGSGAQTLSGLSKGDQAQVSATVADGTNTATRIVSGDLDKGWPRMPGRGGMPRPSASPSAS